MNQYDMHRLADAIWTIRQYYDSIEKILYEKDYSYMDVGQFERILCSIQDSIGDVHY